jgi:DNA repair protein RadC
MLDRKNKVIGVNPVSMGSLTASVVHPCEVFKATILANAAAVILGRTHPSGDPQPGQEDRVLTARLSKARQLLGIEVLDHVIIGDGSTEYVSFADQGSCSGTKRQRGPTLVPLAGLLRTVWL